MRYLLIALCDAERGKQQLGCLSYRDVCEILGVSMEALART